MHVITFSEHNDTEFHSSSGGRCDDGTLCMADVADIVIPFCLCHVTLSLPLSVVPAMSWRPCRGIYIRAVERLIFLIALIARLIILTAR